MGANEDTLSRRTYLKATGAASVAGLGGLTGLLGQDFETLEVQHWWTGGDGAAAIEALFEGFEQKHSNIKVNQNPVAGGAGQNLHTVIKKRVLNDNPPSSWQAWPGANLLPFTRANKLENIGQSVWSHNGMQSAYLQGPKDAARPSGDFVTVPLNIHRINNLFYNVNVVEQADVDPSSISKPSDLVGAMEQVNNNTDAAGMAHQTKSGWSTLQLWTTVLLGEHGLDTYTAFTEGRVEQNQQAVKNSLRIVKDYKQFFNDDAGSIGWTEANTKVINGQAGFFHQGDWAAGMYSPDNLEFEKGWNQVAFPGTEGYYMLNMDSFPFPTNNPSPDATTQFLRYVGSVDAQRRFNPKKGSIPPRTDVPQDAFGPFLQRQMKEFKNSEAQPPSTAHGLAVDPETLTNLEDAMATFISSWNVQRTYDGMVQAFQ
ncbi:ABC transporter substrate-binding protein [Halorussus caseinilyticus]|uniref:ABC transporter substrate-binding protein n=1 Tax=Halorussus caseinilyticus TaxID=3034025 RepID=UPI0023E76322|nr:ABC transporter substrate-binding protein [Halorussus sp. DT72]